MWIKFVGFSLLLFNLSNAHQHKSYESQLYEDLLYDYNKIPRPVKNSSEVLMVDVGASLIRIIDVDEKNQILTLMLWLEMKWVDEKLRWQPERYGNIKVLHIPSDLLWTPDLVLYNNAAGDPDITIFTDALVTYTGQVYWSPPSIYKSFCAIDISFFPFDTQICDMKFGAWSYTGYYLDLRQIDMTSGKNQVSETEEMENGMDLSFFYKSAEWDLLSLRSARHSVLYASCCGPEKYVDITYYFKLRRKTLFYTSNLIIPCFLISFLTTFVFYLSHHKITFSISILVTLTVFFLVLIDIIPPTSLVIPMFGRYLITTMILVSLSTMVSVVTVNFRFRSGAAHEMSPWTRSIFLKCLPRLLFMERPEKNERLTKRRQSLAASQAKENQAPTFTETTKLFNSYNSMPQTRIDAPQKRERFAKFKSKNRFQLERDISSSYDPYAKRSSFSMQMSDFTDPSPMYTSLHLPNRRETIGITDIGASYTSSAHASNSLPHHHHCHNQQQNQKKQSKAESLKNTKEKINDLILMKLVQQVRLIAEYFRRQEEETEISDDWQYVAMVLDRLFLIIFSVLNFGTFLILLEAPTLHETVFPMNDTLPTKPLGHPSIV